MAAVAPAVSVAASAATGAAVAAGRRKPNRLEIALTKDWMNEPGLKKLEIACWNDCAICWNAANRAAMGFDAAGVLVGGGITGPPPFSGCAAIHAVSMSTMLFGVPSLSHSPKFCSLSVVPVAMSRPV